MYPGLRCGQERVRLQTGRIDSGGSELGSGSDVAAVPVCCAVGFCFGCHFGGFSALRLAR